ncbi:MAG: PIG-L family deacetylase [Lachnospiraceae bacterium]|nr:PIG-L family deacetylase [Lachnospiraceae bacterium]
MDNDLFSMSSRIRYSFPIHRGGKVLVLTPHPDDETIGCAGSLLCLGQKDIEITVVLFTQPKEQKKSEDRLKEFDKATKFIGCIKHIQLGYPDGDLKDYYKSAKDSLERIISEEKPDIIFTPYIFDYHYDHKCVSKMLSEVIKDENVLIAMYEVWVPILHPSYYIDITQYWEKKQHALTIYKSQDEIYSIIQKASMLNQLRAQLSMRKNVSYIESFQCFKGERFRQLIEPIYL